MSESYHNQAVFLLKINVEINLIHILLVLRAESESTCLNKARFAKYGETEQDQGELRIRKCPIKTQGYVSYIYLPQNSYRICSL